MAASVIEGLKIVAEDKKANSRKIKTKWFDKMTKTYSLNSSTTQIGFVHSCSLDNDG